MIKAIVLISLYTLVYSSISCLNAQSIIPWSKTTKLEWSDFKAPPNTDIIGYAQTSYKIEIQPSDVAVDENNNIQNYQSLSVVANFYTNHSWVFKKDDYLLKHEQLHFDIAGLYARKMMIEFDKLKKNKIADFDSYMSVYKSIWTECRNIQKKYDKETNHGLLVEANNSWIEEIASEINKI
ncbi:hypothetical protein [uncultured Algibacter sp.]|uniref:DUF922 domain-containing protein n=1 Tax=uncultured Algibacter sp. TaxID=298659 RepID=UPI002639C7F9|nr:hypothetical protein [uncultured Algibacter sp.]